MSILSALWGRFAGHVAALAAFIGLLLAAFLGGRREGKSLMRGEQERQRRKAITDKGKRDDEIDRLGPAALEQRLHRWLRRDGR
ncbi:hypothetical protein FG93_01079 [Bosea sp. LC85]|nr:hypothetical protein FG93_01079 [Bosea sp. LC85]